MGVWQAGCFYAPLDPSLPEERLRLILTNLQPQALVCDAGRQAKAAQVCPAGCALMPCQALEAQEEDGALLAYAGVEGEDYVWNADGTWSFNLTGSRTINDVRANVLMYTGAAMPGLYPSDFISKVASPVDQHVFEQNERVHAVSEQVIPAHALSLERQQRANELTAVLGGLVDRGVARFATGEIELNDETYAAWLSELKAAGSDELVAMYEALPQTSAEN